MQENIKNFMKKIINIIAITKKWKEEQNEQRINDWKTNKSPELRYSENSRTAIARFTLAVDRPTRQGEDKKADFPNIVVFGKQAENCDKYLEKGSLVGITGRIQTGSYQNKNNITIYTVNIIATNVQFLSWKEKAEKEDQQELENAVILDEDCTNFEAVEDNLPF